MSEVDSTDSGSAFEEWSIEFVWWGGVVLLVIGVLKLVLYAVGRSRPALFQEIRSPTLKRFLSGKGNRMVFGVGGLITALAGGGFMLAARGLAWLLEQTRL